MRRSILLLICLLTALAVCAAPALGESAAPRGPGRPGRGRATASPTPEPTRRPSVSPVEQGVPGHNALILVDGGPNTADPDGHRFDAALLAFENLAGSGEKGKIAAIVFSAEGCVTYGPVNLGADYAELEAAVGEPLGASTVGDEPSDIIPALRAARRLIYGFGPNDETDILMFISEADSWVLNPEPDSAAAELIADITAAGARLYAVYLAGDALDARALETLIRAESDVEATGRVTAATPLEETFQVPYAGIARASVNLTFDPANKNALEQVALTDPSGAACTLWDADGAHPQPGISVQDGGSYLLMTITDPQPGDWTLSVTGEGVPVDALLRFDHGLRLTVSADSFIDLGSAQRVTARFDTDRDLTGLYDQSAATLQLFAPGESDPAQTLEMVLENGRYTAEFTPDRLGIWTGRVVVENPWLRKTADSLAFEVITPPTPSPTPQVTPTPTPIPALVPIEGIAASVSPALEGGDGALYLDASADTYTFAWTIDGEADAQSAELLEDGKVILRRIQNGDTAERSLFRPGAAYTLRITAMPKNGAVNGADPVVTELSFALPPAVVPVKGLTLSVEPVMPSDDEALYVDRAAEAVTVSWTLDGEADEVRAAVVNMDANVTVREGLKSGDRLDRALFEDNVTYALRVSALPKNGALNGADPTVETLEFALYPEAAPITGLTLDVPGASLQDDVYQLDGSQGTLAWRCESGEADHYELLVTDPQSAIVLQQTLPGNVSSYPLTLDQRGGYRVTLIATPRYAATGDLNATATLTVRPKLPGFLQKYWYLLVGGAALLAGLVALAVFLKNKTARKVTGAVRIACYEPDAAVNTLVVFSGDGKGMKLGSPLTAHPAIAKYKGKKLYSLLANVKVSMAATDNAGNAPGGAGADEVQHRANTPLISFTWAPAKGTAGQTVYVGRYDLGYSTLHIADGGKTYDIMFCDSKSIMPPTKPEPEPEPEPPVTPAPPEEKTADEPPAEKTVEPDDLPPAKSWSDDLPPANDTPSTSWSDDLPPANSTPSTSWSDDLPPASDAPSTSWNDDLPPANSTPSSSWIDDLPPADETEDDAPSHASDYFSMINADLPDEGEETDETEKQPGEPEEQKPFFM